MSSGAASLAAASSSSSSSSASSGSSASHYDYAAARIALEERNITPLYAHRSHRFEQVDGPSSAWVAILSRCFKAAIPPSDDDEEVKKDVASKLIEMALPAIQVMDAVHKSEEDFSRQLFKAFVSCFEAGGWVVLCPPKERKITKHARAGSDDEEAGERFVFNDMVVVGRRWDDRRDETLPSGESSGQEGAHNMYVCYVGNVKYAMGLSRKAKMKEDKCVPSIIEGDSFPDYSWVIFKKEVLDTGGATGTQIDDIDAHHDDTDGWSVHHLVAAIELKMETSSGKVFDLLRSPMKREADGSQRTTSTSVGANHRALYQCGPLVQELAYVVGHVLPGRASLGLGLPAAVPFAVVAGRSTHNEPNVLRWVHGNVVTPEECGGRFDVRVDAFDRFRQGNGTHALAAGLDVLVNGLEVAEEWLVKQAAHSPALLLPPKPLSGRTVKFGGTTLEGLKLIYSPLTNRGLDRSERTVRASQGEMFGGELNLLELKRKVPNSRQVSWCRNTFDGKANQQVLVKVVSCALYGRLVGQEEGLLWKIYTTAGKRGLVQIMPDLSAESEKFDPLYPGLCATRNLKSAMWTAFERLVRKTLIPLAEADVIHPDIRPGYDHTSNLLWNESKEEMRIIDLDSLVEFDNWSCPTDDKRYISKEDLANSLQTAFDFLLCQVVVITDSWIHEIREGEADAGAILRDNDMIMSWERADPWRSCDKSYLLENLRLIGDRFALHVSEIAES